MMKHVLFISTFIWTLSSSLKANIGCINTASNSGITIRFTASCRLNGYQSVLDSFVNQLSLKIKRPNTSYNILALVNFEHLYYDGSNAPEYFISIGVDTLREMNDVFISNYNHHKYKTTAQSRPFPLDINATDENDPSNEIGIKIIYNCDYREQINWKEVQRLIEFSAFNYNDIKIKQKRDTVRHFSWYVSLLTMDTTAIHKIIGRPHELKQKEISINEQTKSINAYWITGILGFVVIGLIILKYRT